MCVLSSKTVEGRTFDSGLIPHVFASAPKDLVSGFLMDHEADPARSPGDLSPVRSATRLPHLVQPPLGSDGPVNGQ